MSSFRTITALVLAVATTLSAQRPAARAERSKAELEAEARPRLGPPKRLLTTPFKWQTQSGAWKADSDAGSVAGASDGTLAEYGATASLPLSGRWLALKVALSGPGAKAGAWLAGVRDAKGEVLRLALDSASGGLVGGRGQSIAALPDGAFAASIEIVLTFTTDKVTIHHGGHQLAELPVTFDEPQATPSLFVERGEATFTDLLLSGDPLPPSPVAAPRKPVRPVDTTPVAGTPPAPAVAPAQPAVQSAPVATLVAPANATWTFDFTPGAMTALKSTWNEYFGIHHETGAGPWKMVRQFDGPEFGIPAQGRHTGDVKQYPGPFGQVPVEVSLGDFRDWKRKDAKGLDENLKALVKDDRQALFIAPWAGPIGKLEQDHIYALMKIAYGTNPAAENRLFFQWGDSLNDGHYGLPSSARRIYSSASGSTRLSRGANLPAELVTCAENYLAPAIEAIRFASEEIYQNPRRIPIIAGSCGAASNPENRAWYGQLFDRTLEGTAAPSLKGRHLASLVDILTVNYPFAEVENDAALQEIWDRFCAPDPAAAGAEQAEEKSRPRGLWVTEEYGNNTKGSASLLVRAARFLAWAARNQLDASQTRLLWHIAPRLRGAEDALTTARSSGEKFAALPLRVAAQDLGDSRLIRVTGGDGRLLLVHQPVTIRRGKRAVPIGEIALTVTEAQAAQPWVAHVYLDQGKKPLADGPVLPVRRDGNQLRVNLPTSVLEPWALLLDTP